MFRVVHFFVCRVTNPCNYRNAGGLESKDLYEETGGVGSYDSVGGVALLSVYVGVCLCEEWDENWSCICMNLHDGHMSCDRTRDFGHLIAIVFIFSPPWLPFLSSFLWVLLW